MKTMTDKVISNQMAIMLVKNYRKSRMLTQQELADQLSVNRTAVTKWELGQQQVPAWVITTMYPKLDKYS